MLFGPVQKSVFSVPGRNILTEPHTRTQTVEELHSDPVSTILREIIHKHFKIFRRILEW